MVRKKTAAADKGTPRKSVRTTRRRKKSTSESEPDLEEKETVEVEKAPDTNEAEASRGGRSTRRSTRSRNQPEVVEPQEEIPEEKPTTPEDNAPPSKPDPAEERPQPSSSSKSAENENEDGGTTWKVQSSNGSGGEIQKLKICRQRLTDSAESSSSPAKEMMSPRRKRYRKRKGGRNDLEGGTESPGSYTDSEAPTSTMDYEQTVEEDAKPEDSVVIDSTNVVADDIIVMAADSGTSQLQENDETQEEPTESVQVEANNDTVLTEVDHTTRDMQPSRINEDQTETPMDDSASKPESNELMDTDEKNKDEITPGTDVISEKLEDVVAPPPTCTDLPEPEQSTSPPSEPEQEKSTEDAVPSTDTTETKNVPPMTVKKPGKNLMLSVSNEEAMQQIAKKLNERAAARGPKEPVTEEQTKPLSNEMSSPPPALDTSKEDGEISSAAATPENFSKSKPSLIVNKPKEVNSKPTILKRMTEVENAMPQRRRRVSHKPKQEEPQIAISSTSLKTLVPEVQPVPLEEVKESLMEVEQVKDEVATPEVKEPSIRERITTASLDEPKPKKRFELKDVTIRVENDVREVKKKTPIVISHKPDVIKETNEVPPTEENHKVVRKISIVSDDAKALRRSLSPVNKKATQVLFITNLVRPFTVPQLRELLARTGTIAQYGFYIDKIKSKCYVKYVDVEMAIETRHALHGVRWPINNPKTLRVEFSTDEAMSVVQKIADEELNAAKKQEVVAVSTSENDSGWLNEKTALKPARRVTTAVREWDVGKTGGGGEDGPFNVSTGGIADPKKGKEDDWSVKAKDRDRERGRAESERRRALSPDSTEPSRKIKKRESDAPAKLLDDLFKKTKATPCIYWLPLTAEQIAVKEEMRRQHMAEHERRLAELRKSDLSRRDKGRSRDRERERERERDRDRRKK